MPRRITIPFVGPHAQGRSAQVVNQETLNLTHSVHGPGAKAPVILDSIPGLVQHPGTVGTGAVRTPRFIQWRHPTDGTVDAYAVFGRSLVRIKAALETEIVGTLDDFTTTCRIAGGRTHLMVVDGSFGYSYDGTTFAKIADLDFPDADFSPAASPTHVVYQDTFFIVNDANSDNFHISDPEDPDSWNALEFEAASVAPDRALALANTESELWILGEESAQAYYNSGNADFPYAIILAATQEVGIFAPQSVAETDAGIFFLGTTPEGGLFVYQIKGQGGRIISGEEQETQIARAGDVSGATGFIYSQAGKSFYVLRLNDSVPSLVFNIRAGAWETRARSDGTAWRIGGTGVLKGESIGGSRLGALLYRFDLNNYTDAGQPLVRRRVTQIYHNNNQLMDWWELVVDCQSGVGTPSGDGSDPMLSLRYSDDGGFVWSSKILEPLGKIGARERRAVFRSLGQSRNRIFEVEFSDPVEFTIIAAYAYLEVLDD